MTNNAIEARGLSKSFSARTQRRTSFKERVVRGRAPAPDLFWALRDATFNVPKGASVGLIGQNGSGKSTALKVLTGIYRPTSGHVEVNGRVSALLEVGAGFHPELTGRENIRLNATILGFTNREIDRLMDQIIEFADIGDHIDSPIKHYSSGMYVRLGFSVAVMVRPDILLVDEVIAVGDEEFQRKCFEYLYDLRREGTSMVIVSHGLGQITDLCDEAVLLDHGRVAAVGPADRVVRTYLEAVNLREVERRGAAEGSAAAGDVGGGPSVPPAETQMLEPAVAAEVPTRRGSGELRLTRVELLDESGQQSALLFAGRQVVIRMHYLSKQPLDGVVLDIPIEDHADRLVCHITSRHVQPFSVSQGSGYFEFRFEPLLLAGGTYRLRPEVSIGSHLVDALDEGATLVVRAPDVEIGGTFLQPGTWGVRLPPAGADCGPPSGLE